MATPVSRTKPQMKYILLTFAFTFCTVPLLFGQTCDCVKNVKLLQQKVEANQASYQHQVIEQNRLEEYAIHKAKINELADKTQTKKDCIGLIALYISFFRDEHAFMTYTANYRPQPNRIVKSKRKNNTEKSPMEGLWYFQDGSFSIDVVPAKTSYGEWIAVINETKSTSWKKGQLKIEFFKHQNGTMGCIYWWQNLIPKALTVTHTDSNLQIGRNLSFFRQQPKEQPNSSTAQHLHFASLSEKTNYLSIPSFDLSCKNQIDSLINHHRLVIASKENLIIDLRNNAGGGFDAFQSLLPYILDTNLTEYPYQASVWVSHENYAYYDSTKYDYAETKQDSADELEYVAFLKNHIGRFSPIESSVDTVQLAKNSPKQISLIFNRNTASTAEGFILQASRSKKVLTYGENSAGAVSYGDWVPVELTDLNIWVAMTTKKMIFKNKEDFESTGIAPQMPLTDINENEWIDVVLTHMEKLKP